MVRLLTSHLAKTLLEQIQSSVKQGQSEWNKDNWVFPQIESETRWGSGNTTCLVTSELLVEKSDQVIEILDFLTKLSKTDAI